MIYFPLILLFALQQVMPLVYFFLCFHLGTLSLLCMKIALMHLEITHLLQQYKGTGPHSGLVKARRRSRCL